MGEMADAQFDDFCWGLSDPNGEWDWDEYEDGWPTNIRRYDPTKWRCKDGTVVNIVDMTDSHIANAIAYCERKGKSFVAVPLMEEQQRRIDARYMGIKMECPFCQGTMQRLEYHSDPEEGPGWGWIKYAFTCKDCGARGPLHDKHEPKTLQRRTTQRNPKSIR